MIDLNELLNKNKNKDKEISAIDKGLISIKFDN
jgi:hypothetical protein